jgi:hypothetical protein
MDRSAFFWDYQIKGLAACLPALFLMGCTAPGVIQGVNPVQPIPSVETTCRVENGKCVDAGPPLSVIVNGTGRCAELKIDWGDSLNQTYQYIDLQSNPVFTHTFCCRGGGKTVTVEGTARCTGKVNTRFVMEPSVYQLGFNVVPSPTAQICHQMPGNFPAIGKHDLVKIKTSPASSFPAGVNFGCPLNSCIYDADGRPGSVADSSFPFPGLKEFSLVLRVGTQVWQGGTNTSFLSNGNAGSLEICLNDSTPNDNGGGYRVDITIDQLGP